jgi:hypothetical protein
MDGMTMKHPQEGIWLKNRCDVCGKNRLDKSHTGSKCSAIRKQRGFSKGKLVPTNQQDKSTV